MGLKRYEVRHGTRTAGISGRRDGDVEEEEEMSPQEGGDMTNASDENRTNPLFRNQGVEILRRVGGVVDFRIYREYRNSLASLMMISYVSIPMNGVTLNAPFGWVV